MRVGRSSTVAPAAEELELMTNDFHVFAAEVTCSRSSALNMPPRRRPNSFAAIKLYAFHSG